MIKSTLLVFCIEKWVIISEHLDYENSLTLISNVLWN